MKVSIASLVVSALIILFIVLLARSCGSLHAAMDDMTRIGPGHSGKGTQ